MDKRVERIYLLAIPYYNHSYRAYTCLVEVGSLEVYSCEIFRPVRVDMTEF